MRQPLTRVALWRDSRAPLVAAAALALSACAIKPPPVQLAHHPDVITYYPIKVGERRYFLTAELGAEGATAGAIIREITGEKEVSGGLCSLESITRQETGPDQAPQFSSQQFVIMRRVDAVQVARVADGTDPGWATEFSAPVRIGREWRLIPAQTSITCKIKAVEKLALPLITAFDCVRVATYVRIEGSGESLVGEKWFAPGRGVVAESSYRPDGALQGYVVFLGTAPPTEAEAKRVDEYLRTHPNGP